MSTTSKPATSTATTLQAAFDFFNARFWNGELPVCMVLVHRKARAHGYYWPQQFQRIEADDQIDEIALNPETMMRGDKEVLSTLLHEMCHHWQQHFGKPSAGGYHNKQWAAEMKRVGLTPSTTGRPGGKETGHSVSHYVTPRGAYADAFRDWSDQGLRLEWAGSIQQLPAEPAEGDDNSEDEGETRAEKSRKSKTKFTCPDCQQNAWAKPTANIVCGDCLKRMESPDAPAED